MAIQYGKPTPDQVRERRSNKYGDEAKDREPKPQTQDPSPTSKVVEAFHKNAEVDQRHESIHHTIGSGPFQSAAGDHAHDGNDSMLLLQGYTITGQKSSPATVLPTIIAALVRLGAKDSTT